MDRAVMKDGAGWLAAGLAVLVLGVVLEATDATGAGVALVIGGCLTVLALAVFAYELVRRD